MDIADLVERGHRGHTGRCTRAAGSRLPQATGRARHDPRIEEITSLDQGCPHPLQGGLQLPLRSDNRRLRYSV